MPWVWNEKSHRYRDTDTGRYLSRSAVLRYVQASLDAARTSQASLLAGGVNSSGTDLLANLVANGMLSPPDWHMMMREQIKREYIRQYLLGRGGRGSMTGADWGSIGGMLREQYRWLDDFARLVADGALSEGQIRSRAAMYVNSAREAFERGKARAWGIPDGKLPAMPGDGSTICLCITTPLSRVLTQRGWLPLIDVRVGDLVLTHRHRWRPVTALLVKPSPPGCQHNFITTPSGQVVGCTVDHWWYTPDGWRNSNYIDNSSISVYHVPITIGGGEHGQEEVRNVRGRFVKPEQAEPVHVMSVGMCLREIQGLSGITMQGLCLQREGQEAMEGKAGVHIEWYQEGGSETANPIGRFRQAYLAGATGWQAMELVLAKGRGQEADHIPVSVGMDNGKRTDPRRPCGASQGRQPIQRCVGESRIDPNQRPRQASWPDNSCACGCQDARVDLPDLREGVQEIPAWQEWSPQVLFSGVLPSGTAIYDLTVEEDASFVVEGLIAHNTNCNCSWRIEEVYDDDDVLIGWDCYWVLGPVKTEHCSDCLDRAAKWNPFEIRL